MRARAGARLQGSVEPGSAKGAPATPAHSGHGRISGGVTGWARGRPLPRFRQATAQPEWPEIGRRRRSRLPTAAKRLSHGQWIVRGPAVGWSRRLRAIVGAQSSSAGPLPGLAAREGGGSPRAVPPFGFRPALSAPSWFVGAGLLPRSDALAASQCPAPRPVAGLRVGLSVRVRRPARTR